MCQCCPANKQSTEPQLALPATAVTQSPPLHCSCRLCELNAGDVSLQAYQPDVQHDEFWEHLFEQRRCIQLAAISNAVKTGTLGPVQDLLLFQHVFDESAQQALESQMHQSGTAMFQLAAENSLLHYANDGYEKLASALDRVSRQLNRSQPGSRHFIIKPYNSQVDGGLSEILDLFNETRLQLLQLYCTAPASQCETYMRHNSDTGNDSSDDASAGPESVTVTRLPHIVLVVTVSSREKRKPRDSDSSQQGSAKRGKTQLTPRGSECMPRLLSAGSSFSSPVSVSPKASSSADFGSSARKSRWGLPISNAFPLLLHVCCMQSVCVMLHCRPVDCKVGTC